MPGRYDLLSGQSTCDWDLGHSRNDARTPQMKSRRRIMRVVNAIMEADAYRAVITCLRKNLNDNARKFYPIGAPVQLCVNRKWPARSESYPIHRAGVIVAKGNRISKWPMSRTILACLRRRDRAGDSLIPGFRPARKDREM